ncbi:hypothetical protein ACRE_028910 [Hapsidospora chrysogenum ATCC 11550]|uniref:Uncharacterized protein n=1 Tax=Hapsidospora chrysogenum (strain ATCC 11550 / CBS 779.69 / DSM 880 / IAM 14645 / JCM 23072 / IMI 49137) TaxID=857340 RepID=A0A086TAA8_HAPC1|nr:hypothetical protein ACRE_028910 [Hapsidospora chrysogenum ATCC 11550]
MCFEPRIVFACDCEKPKDENAQQQQLRWLCEWAAMGGNPCSGAMIGTDPYVSTEVMYECLECLARAEPSKDKSKLSGLKNKLGTR